MNTETLSKLSARDVMDIGDLYMRTLQRSDGVITDSALTALGQFCLTRWPVIRAALEKVSKDV